MTRLAIAALLLGLLAFLTFLAVTLLEDERDPPPAKPTAAAERGFAPGSAGPPASARRDRARDPAERGAAGDAPNPPPGIDPGAEGSVRASDAPRPILRVAKVTMRTEASAPPRDPAVLPPPPIGERSEGKKPFRCEITVVGARPLHLEVRAGSPWGTRRFSAEVLGPGRFRFRLVDPWAGHSPRILRFVLAKAPHPRHVDRFLPRGKRRAEFRIGLPGDLTGRLVDTRGRGIRGSVKAHGGTAGTDRNGRFRLRGIRAGRAVVHAFAADARHAVRRAVLAASGKDHEIVMEPGKLLRLRIEGLTASDTTQPPVWACAVTGSCPGARGDFAAETLHHRTTRTGDLRFGPVPHRWRGVVALHHPRFASRFVSIGDVLVEPRPIRLEPRTVLLGTVVHAKTGHPVDAELSVTTSADGCTLLDLARARKILPALRAPSAGWRHPIPFLGLTLVEIDHAPTSGHDFEIHADPALRRLAVRVQAEGYHPQVKTDVRLGGVRRLVFRLQPDRPAADASLVLALPAAPAGTWKRLVIKGHDAARARVDPARGEVRFEGLVPGLYWFELVGAGKVAPLQVDVAESAQLRLRFPE